MPTYEYRCARCGEHLEIFQSFTEAPLTKHPECGGKLAKVLSPAGIILKGSGFYKKDSADSARSKSKARASKPSTSTTGTSDTATKSGGSDGAAKSGDSSGGAAKPLDSSGRDKGTKTKSTTAASKSA